MVLGIYGTGGSGQEVYEILECNESIRTQWSEVVFIDDTREKGTFRDCQMMPFAEFVQMYKTLDAEIVIAVGEPKYRKILGEKVRTNGYELATIIHPLAFVSPTARIGKGVVLQESVYVSAGADVGNNTYVNGKTIIGHNVTIGENSQISSFAIIAGTTTVGENAYIGVSSAIRDHLHIGDNVVVSMGAMVMKDVRDNKIVMGNPAREMAENTDKQVFK